MKTLKKPEPVKRYDYHEVMKYLQEKYNFHNDRDYYDRWGLLNDFNEKCLEKIQKTFKSVSFYTKSPPLFTEDEKEQHKLFHELKNVGLKTLPEDLSFWRDVVLENHEISNGSTFTLYEEFIEDIEIKEYKNIINWMMDEFGDGPIGERFVQLEVSW